ncbi:MAG: hypothetical protein M1822_006043 [Bathelium mastoideum]|nr:MAG: hypothetical protein M1822_006043 [Bathelium mastoideum]
MPSLAQSALNSPSQAASKSDWRGIPDPPEFSEPSTEPPLSRSRLLHREDFQVPVQAHHSDRIAYDPAETNHHGRKNLPYIENFPHPPGVFQIPSQARYPDLIMQPDSRPISHEQLAAEVKGIYAGLVMVEGKCISVDYTQTTPQENITSEHWQALVALHKALLHEHHDFLLASQHPSMSSALRKPAAKYSVPGNIRMNGNPGRSRRTGSRNHLMMGYMNHLKLFLHQSMAVSYKTVTEKTWVECLSDLRHYLKTVKDDDYMDRLRKCTPSRIHMRDREPLLEDLRTLGLVQFPYLFSIKWFNERRDVGEWMPKRISTNKMKEKMVLWAENMIRSRVEERNRYPLHSKETKQFSTEPFLKPASILTWLARVSSRIIPLAFFPFVRGIGVDAPRHETQQGDPPMEGPGNAFPETLSSIEKATPLADWIFSRLSGISVLLLSITAASLIKLFTSTYPERRKRYYLYGAVVSAYISMQFGVLSDSTLLSQFSLNIFSLWSGYNYALVDQRLMRVRHGLVVFMLSFAIDAFMVKYLSTGSTSDPVSLFATWLAPSTIYSIVAYEETSDAIRSIKPRLRRVVTAFIEPDLERGAE